MENPDGAFPNRIRPKINLENGRPGEACGKLVTIVNTHQMDVRGIFSKLPRVFSAYINGELASNLGSFPMHLCSWS
jgi:hypothetical protein